MVKEETSTDGEAEVIWLVVRPALELPRVTNVSVVMVLMLEARAADTSGSSVPLQNSLSLFKMSMESASFKEE